jgi:hypothetical protein
LSGVTEFHFYASTWCAVNIIGYKKRMRIVLVIEYSSY